ncbi:hypothetical protein NIES267_61860 [Calothrix parasitica NIES-267]|uniref:Filamentous hemagglutinin outer membrane protein n=1 Tax=Calothrix parasitica NIES-267 TaxID=1973488 RepID=A0A1Z4LZL5_9CYAN|nr:hypothetical protein NIES267_61860 [Calothrix parasitica NIES-267]
MKFSQKLSISLFAATASLLSFSSGAFAGEGGAAGAAAFTIDGGNVTGVAVAASVGKQDAGAAAFNDVTGNFNSAFSLGSAGPIDMQGIGDPAAAGMTGAADTDLGTAQANELTGNATIRLGTASGEVIANPGVTTP